MRAAVAALALLGLAHGCDRSGDPDAASGSRTVFGGTQTGEQPTPARPDWASWGPVTGRSDVRLLEAELDRDPAAAALRESLQASTPAVREYASWSLARIGGPVAARWFIEAIETSGPSLTPAMLAAIASLEPPAGALADPALPEAPWGTLEDAVWSRYAATEGEHEAEALLLGIARVGGPRSQIRLAADLAVLPAQGDERRWHAGMEAVGILCARGLAVGRGGLQAIVAGLSDARSTVRTGAAYALSRCAAPSAEHLAGEERKILIERLSARLSSAETDEEEERLVWRSLAGLGEIPEAIPASIAGSTPPPWIVEVEAAQALASHADGRQELTARLGALPTDAFSDGPRVHVVLGSLRALRAAVDGTPELVERLEPLRVRIATALESASTTERQRERLGRIDCELRVLVAITSGDVTPIASCTAHLRGAPDALGDVLAVEALVHTGKALPASRRADALIARANDPRPNVAEAALSALADLDDSRVGPTLRTALEHQDVGVLAAATGSISARAMDRSRRDPDAVDPLLAMLARVDNGTGIEARILAVEALGRLGVEPRSDAAAPRPVPSWLEEALVSRSKDPAVAIRRVAREALRPLPELAAGFDESEPEAFPGGFDATVTSSLEAFGTPEPRGLRIHTDEGVIEIAFDGAPAPIAQANLVALARRGYFDGLRFHRVVPGFVVQGGDPRGDGYGGPGWLVPCERSNLRFERGTVGIALAGKDTGGSQFFITHTPQPHLDGRYPVVGRVVTGMDVVDRLLPHDVMRRVEVIDGEAT